MNNNYVNRKENFTLVSILIASFLTFMIKDMFFLFTWVLNLLVLNNVRRISFKNIYTSFLRISLYFLHFFIFFLIFLKVKKDIVYFKKSLSIYVFLVILNTIIFHFFRYKNLFKILFRFDYVNNFPKNRILKYFLDFYSQFGGAVCEELYFRYCLINIFYSYGIFSIFIATFYFFLSHYLLPWSRKFTRNDFFNQIIYGIFLGYVFYSTHSILLCIFLHLFFNFHTILFPIISCYYYYLKKNKTDMSDEFDDIEV